MNAAARSARDFGAQRAAWRAQILNPRADAQIARGFALDTPPQRAQPTTCRRRRPARSELSRGAQPAQRLLKDRDAVFQR
jgi:hypothetical protein